MLDVSVIIVNYNTANVIRSCIESILRQRHVHAEIFVVDNASTDDSVDRLRSMGDTIHLVLSPENLGYGRANNLAFQQVKGRYVILLNPDTRLQREEDLRNLITFMDVHPEYGLASARVLDEKGNKETPPKKYYPGEKYIGRSYQNLPGQHAWVLGACMILLKRVYEEVGGFDERFFLYGEDADLCLMLRRRGYAIGYFPDVKIIHIGHASERKTSSFELSMKKQKSLFSFYQKHYSKSDTNYLVAREYKQARRRLFLHKLRCRSRVAPNPARLEHYRAVCESSRRFLSGEDDESEETRGSG